MQVLWPDLLRKAKDIRRELHKIPELSWQETNTAGVIRGKLDQLGISWKPCAKTGTVARIAQRKPGPHLAFRADIDALPLDEAGDLPWKSTLKGSMHSCGHDGHMAVLLATAEWLKQHEDRLQGPVSFIFQPAEEGGYGAREMIIEGALAGVDMIYGWHNWPTIAFGKAVCPSGPVMAANGSFRIVLSGQGGHASQPEMCRDPVLAAAAVTMGLQQLVSRRLSPNRAAVVSVSSIDAVSQETIIPDKAILKGSVRIDETALIDKLGELIRSSAVAIAKGYNVTAKVEFWPGYPALINHRSQAEMFQRAIGAEFGADWLCSDTATPIMASEDFSYYLGEIPGAFALVGAGDGGLHDISCHNCGYDFNDNLIEPLVRIFSRLAGVIEGEC